MPTDADIDICAREVFDIVAQFDSPKDAASALTMAQWYMIKAAFPPEDRAGALDAIQATANLLKDLINEGWQ